MYCSQCNNNIEGILYFCLTCAEVLCINCHKNHSNRHVCAKLDRPTEEYDFSDTEAKNDLLLKGNGTIRVLL